MINFLMEGNEFDIHQIPNSPTSKSLNPQIIKYPNPQIFKSLNNQIPKSSNPQIIK